MSLAYRPLFLRCLPTFLFFCLVAVAGCGKKESATASAGGAKYFCPMHPTYTSDRPGDCPICNMKLVPVKSPDAMKAHTEGAGGSIPGRVSIDITPEKQQMIGVQTSTAETRELSGTIHATAVVQHDERRLTRITPRFAGWLRDLKVNYTGQVVEKGQPLFTVYSPELFSTEREYLLALQQTQKLKDASVDVKQSAERLLEAARKRLELWQISPADIQAIADRGTPADELVFRSPVGGHVISKTAVEGKSFMTGETLYEIADLGHLWVRASIFESDLAEINVGQKARVVFPQLGDKSIESTVSFIYPHIDPQTRRGEIRIEIENPDLVFKPDMWVEVQVEVTQPIALVIPASAVIDTGVRHVAFVDKGEGKFEPREVKIGAKTDEYYQVLSGVEPGERVVTRALFLVDSESQLKAAISGMSTSGHQE